MLRDICENSVIRAVLTCMSSLVWQKDYTRRTNRSRFRTISSGMFHVGLHGKARVTKLSVISGMQAKSSIRISFDGWWSMMLHGTR